MVNYSVKPLSVPRGNGIHRKIRTRGVRNHFISTQASDTGFGAVWGSTPRFGTHNSLPGLPCIAWCSFRRGRHGKLDGARGGGSGGRSAGGRHPDQASGQPGAACAPLGEQAPPPAAAILHSFGRAGFSGGYSTHRWIRIRVVRNHLISTQASGSGLGAARGSTPRFGTQKSLPCIAWRSWRRGRVSPRF